MAVKSNDIGLRDLLEDVGKGKSQLPDFQRSWVWNNSRICKLIESISSGFPMGAVMFLECNHNSSVKFKYRKFVGVDDSVNTKPQSLVLDGQQRLTTLFQVFKNKTAVETRSDTGKEIKRYYYLDMQKCLDDNCDRLDAIISVPDDKIITDNIGRDIKLDLSTREKEFKELMFPLNLCFDDNEIDNWYCEYQAFYNYDQNFIKTYNTFKNKILNRNIREYKIPVISLDEETSREAVCQIFENVNTGGVTLTVFELVTATFAADDFNLREDWDTIKIKFKTTSDTHNNLLKWIDGTYFIMSMTLLVTYENKIVNSTAVSCKRRDVLRLKLEDYKSNRDYLITGFIKAASFIAQQGIYTADNLPYSTQIIPLAAFFAYDEKHLKKFALANNLELLKQWYWCGVIGELYGSANETRFANDIIGIFEWMNGGEQPDTVKRANFQPDRLLSLKTRNSAAYKGVMALLLKQSPLDFMKATKIDIATFLDENTDIHHIFPKEYCEKQQYPENKWNSIINKTPLYSGTNRAIGGKAPSVYINTMKKKGLTDDQINSAIASHLINPDLLRKDLFNDFISDRAKKLLALIEQSMGKQVSGQEEFFEKL